jgi:hypothetical protein
MVTALETGFSTHAKNSNTGDNNHFQIESGNGDPDKLVDEGLGTTLPLPPYFRI